ncbi:acetone carboxylase [Nocardioides sp. Arc9.136]|uniref:acetone carboxylase n=1 Tax=Nocardioides sp. Arc9.136 TaxID=2996826 RepID=UPI002666456D|nr:acetone carboxylase [Nocardioides sp. Arc9.136]WKN50645.1 acetone carboxylase [Nocardioides sp. Arc9.136]
MDPDTCSAKGCQAPATWQLQWNNPKLHTPERRKVWLACEEHRGSLSDFLAARGFLKDVVPHDPAEERPDGENPG